MQRNIKNCTNRYVCEQDERNGCINYVYLAFTSLYPDCAKFINHNTINSKAKAKKHKIHAQEKK